MQRVIRSIEKKWGAALLVTSLALFVAVSAGASRFSIEPDIAACDKAGPERQQCYAELVESITRRQGIEAGFDIVSRLYAHDREFASLCHGSTHELGRFAHAAFKAAGDVPASPKTSYCGFGFFHGFIEELFAVGGGVAEAQAFCQALDTRMREELPGVSFACYHGIGHGVVDGTDPERWGDEERFIEGGLALCGKIASEEEHQERCASGVFNALAIAYLDSRYRLHPDPNDPYAVCRKQRVHVVRDACFDQMNTYVLSVGGTFSQALSFAAAVEKEFAGGAVESLASFAAQRALTEGRGSAYIAACGTITYELAHRCARGLGVGFIEFGKPEEEYREGAKACLGAGGLRDSCVGGLVSGIYNRLPPDRRKVACAHLSELLGEDTRAACFAGFEITL